jgi:hypothetical protein
VSAEGVRPAPQLVTAVNMPGGGWTPLPALSAPKRVISVESARQIAEAAHAVSGEFWQTYVVVIRTDGQPVTWYLGGVLPAATPTTGAPAARLSIAVVLEADNPQLAQQIGQAFLAELP